MVSVEKVPFTPVFPFKKFHSDMMSNAIAPLQKTAVKSATSRFGSVTVNLPPTSGNAFIYQCTLVDRRVSFAISNAAWAKNITPLIFHVILSMPPPIFSITSNLLWKVLGRILLH